MKHVEPGPMTQALPRKPKRKFSALLWWLMAGGAVLGLGALGTEFLGPPAADMVSQTEIQKRQTGFTASRALSVAAVDPADYEKTLGEMRLAPTEQSQLRARLTDGSESVRLVSMTLWDTHSEDGDVVAVVSAGYRNEIAILHGPQVVSFPVDGTGLVQIVGVRDGGGGITLGVRGPQRELLMPIMSEGQTISIPVAP